MTFFSRTVLALGAFALVSGPTWVSAEPCTAAQLAGTYNAFRFTGSGGSYGAGTQQVASFNHPPNSPVVTLTDVNLVAVANGAVSDLAILSGVPATFALSTDSGASVSLTLPALLASGSYFYRADVMSGSVACTLDSLPFTVTGGGSPVTCVDGARKCLSASTYSVCDNDLWGVSQGCPAGTSCTGAGLCTFQSGGPDDCVEGHYQCQASGISPDFTICAYSTDGELAEIPMTCPSPTNCFQHGDSISCELTSGPDVCALDQRRCVSDTTYQECETCSNGFQWGPIESCPTPQTCTNGVCGLQTTPPPPTCEEGAYQCTASGTSPEFSLCAYNTDGELAKVQFSCPDNTLCVSTGDGIITCELASTPNECTLDARRCVSDVSFQECETSDGELQWGPTQNCQVGQTCTSGVCGLMSVPPVGEACPINGHMQCVEGDPTAFLTCDQNVSVKRECGLGLQCQSYMSDYIICVYPSV